MNKEQLHNLHYLLSNAMYYSMIEDKLPDHMRGIQEALAIIKAYLNED